VNAFKHWLRLRSHHQAENLANQMTTEISEHSVYRCTKCGEQCTPCKVDESFDHEFGTEVVVFYLSDCCEADVEEV
jgi:hypothetical protein